MMLNVWRVAPCLRQQPIHSELSDMDQKVCAAHVFDRHTQR